jgi:predicted RNA-binding protein YlqC (UPF0109 family)
MHDFVEYLIKKLVDKPDSVQLTHEEKENNKVVFQLKVAQEDVGKVIGKKGRTANAIRTLLSAVAAREGKRAILEIIDKEKEKAEEKK